MIIYTFKNKTNGKMYVGQTCRSLEERVGEHLRHSKTAISKALIKYGIENFECEVIDTAETMDELNDKEVYWISKLETLAPNGYNLCLGGGNTLGYKHKEESRKKMSLSKSGMFIGENNPFYGKKHTEETKAKMRKAWTESRKEELREMVKNRNTHTVKVRNVDTGEVFNSVKSAGERYNIEPTHITRVCKGKRKTTGGYRWEYAK